jgi:hypothetical protein
MFAPGLRGQVHLGEVEVLPGGFSLLVGANALGFGFLLAGLGARLLTLRNRLLILGLLFAGKGAASLVLRDPFLVFRVKIFQVTHRRAGGQGHHHRRRHGGNHRIAPGRGRSP